ncbi:hypothetical protein GCM10027275_05660 [Rhabdobacter roseus]
MKAGLNGANLNFETTRTNLAPHAGGLLEVALSDRFLIRPELLYSVKGFRSPVKYGKTRENLRYFTLPVLLGFSPVEKVVVLAGPELGLLTKATRKTPEYRFDGTEDYSRFDLGLVFGLGYKIKENLGIDLRYNYGFTKLITIDYRDPNGNPAGMGKDGSNRVVQVGLYYLLAKK